jgi:hypothetical protein
MIHFPQDPEHQQAHNQVWQRLVQSLNCPDNRTLQQLLWLVVNDMSHSLGIRGAVIVELPRPGAYKLQFQSQAMLEQLGLNDTKQSSLMAAVAQYDPRCQLVVMVIYTTPIPNEYWVDTIVIEVVPEARGGGR